jgi:hypothetical protein
MQATPCDPALVGACTLPASNIRYSEFFARLGVTRQVLVLIRLTSLVNIRFSTKILNPDRHFIP